MSRYQKVNGELTEEGYRKYGNVRRKARKDIVGGALTSAAGAGVGMFGGYAARKLSGGKVNLRFTPKVVGSVMSAHGGKRMAGGAYDLALNKAGVTDDYGRLADSSNPLARPLIDGRKYALGAGAAVGAGVPYAVKALNKDKDNLLGEAIRKTSAKKRVVVKNVERGPGVKDFSMKNSTRKKLNKGFKVINTPEEGPAANVENATESIKPKKQRQRKKKVVVKNVERGPVVNEGNTPEPIKPEKKSKKKILFRRKKKMNNPNNVGEDIDNLNEELMGKWRKGLKRIKHSSLGGNNIYYEDKIYHDGYLDGYYAGMELYHANDSEMTEEEKAAKRRRRRRNIALGVGGAAALGVGGYTAVRAIRKRRKRPIGPTGPKLERVYPAGLDIETPTGWNHKRNKPKYETDALNEGRYKIHKNDIKRYMWDHDKKEAVYVPELDPDLLKWRKKYNL